jgi:hypothetical protein
MGGRQKKAGETKEAAKPAAPKAAAPKDAKPTVQTDEVKKTQQAHKEQKGAHKGRR